MYVFSCTDSIYIISSQIVRIVKFLKKIEFKVNLKQNEIHICTYKFKIIKFGPFSFQNIFEIFL